MGIITGSLDVWRCFVEWMITEIIRVYHKIHHIKGIVVIISAIYQIQFVFPLQAQKEVFVRQLTTVQRVVVARCPVQLEHIQISQASQCAPAALLDITVRNILTASPSSPVLLDSTVLMVDPPKTLVTVMFLHKLSFICCKSLVASKEELPVALRLSLF